MRIAILSQNARLYSTRRLKEAAQQATAPGQQQPDEARQALREELGDLLFALVNLGRKLDLDPEAALAAANLKFRRRFGTVEETLRQRGVAPGDASLQEMDAIWDEAKRQEREDLS